MGIRGPRVATSPRGATHPAALAQREGGRVATFSLIVKSESEKKSEVIFGPLKRLKISEAEVFTLVVIATRAFFARRNSYGFTGAHEWRVAREGRPA